MGVASGRPPLPRRDNNKEPASGMKKWCGVWGLPTCLHVCIVFTCVLCVAGMHESSTQREQKHSISVSHQDLAPTGVLVRNGNSQKQSGAFLEEQSWGGAIALRGGMQSRRSS